ncbi:hypothetical protein K502DRAFT_344070 [Neoconidiobolus thromboides FSU 785]|nr:hypothetical protein K502DRAFT_344070 [Neoconidiobolus thromboides FSU 785]
MGFKVPESPKCCKCKKSVYHVEQVIGPGGLIYHDQCFKCFICKKKLDSTLLTEKNSEIYCKACYAKNFGPKGYGFANGSSFLTTGVYKTDDINDTNTSNDTNNISMSINNDIDSIENSPMIQTPNNFIQSRELINQDVLPSSPVSSFKKEEFIPAPKPSIFARNPSPVAKRFIVKSDTCVKCNKNVYMNEMLTVGNKKYHLDCSRCFKCNKRIENSNLNEHNNEIFCKQCYSREFGPKGYGYANGAAFLTPNGAV